MIILDVNVLVSAHHQESPDHQPLRQWLDDLVSSDQPFGIPELVLCSFIRVVTLPKPWKVPADLSLAMAFCAAVRAAPRAMILQPTETHWLVFERLCHAANARGNLITDAYLAAFAIERDGEWITKDRDFRRFPGLRWRHPLEHQARTNPR